MPISITITDVGSLTKNEMEELMAYLKKSWYLAPSKTSGDPEVIKQELGETQVQYSTFGDTKVVNTEMTVTRPRRKRKAKEIDISKDTSFAESAAKILEANIGDTVCYAPPLKAVLSSIDPVLPESGIGRGKGFTDIRKLGLVDKDLEAATIAACEPDVTPEEVVSYILENTREKKLKFDDVIKLVGQFNIPNINELDKFPDVVVPFYNALKELTGAAQ